MFHGIFLNWLLLLLLSLLSLCGPTSYSSEWNSWSSAANSEMPISHTNVIISMIQDTNEKGHSKDGKEESILLTDENCDQA